MADLSRTIEIILLGKDQASGQFNDVGGALGNLEGAIKTISTPLANAHDKVIDLNAKLGLLSSVAIAGVVYAAGDWEATFKPVVTLMGDATEQIDGLERAVLDYARNSTAPLEDVAQAMYNALSAGADPAGAVELLGIMENLADTALTTLPNATTSVMGLLNAYGEGSDSAAKYADILFAIVKNGITTMDDLVDPLSKVAPMAAAAGVPLEDLGAAVALITSKGTPAATALTEIQGVIAAIISPSAEAAKYADELGIAFNAQALASKGLPAILQEINEKTGGGIEPMNTLFGSIRGLSGALKLIGDDGGDTFLEFIGKMDMSAGGVDKAVALIEKSFDRLNQTLLNNLRITSIQFGKPLLETYGDIALGITNVLRGIGKSLDKGDFDPILNMLKDLGGELAKFIDGIAKSIPGAMSQVDFSGFLNALGGVIGHLQEWFKKIFPHDLTTETGLADFVQDIVDIGESLMRMTEGIMQAWDPVIVAVAQFVQALRDNKEEILGWMEGIGRTFGEGKLVDVIVNQFGPLGVLIKPFAAMVPQVFKKAYEDTGEETTGFLDWFKNIFASSDAVAMELDTSDLDATEDKINDIDGSKVGVGIDAEAQSVTDVEDFLDGLDGGSYGVNVTANVDDSGISTLFDTISDADATVTITADADLAYDALDDLNAIDGSYVDVSILPETGDLDDKLSELAETEIPAAVFIINPDLETTEDALAYLRDLGIIPIEIETGTALERLRDLGFEIDGMSEDDALNFEAQLAIDLGTSKADIAEITKEEQKEVDIRLQVEQAKADAAIAAAEIEGRFAVLQSMVEWRAQLDIAEVEANADKVIAIAGTIEAAFSSSAEIISTALGVLGDMQGFDRTKVFDIIERELDLRAEQVEMQKKLTDAEIKWMEARTKALDRGDAAITINGDGLQPHLEAFMWEILGAIQTRVTEEGLDMLLGVN